MDHRSRQPSRDDAPSPERRKKSPPGTPMTLGNAAAARVRLIVWLQGVRSPGRARPCGDRPAVRRRDRRSRLARSAGVLAMRQPRCRHGGDWDRAEVVRSRARLSARGPRPLRTLEGEGLVEAKPDDLLPPPQMAKIVIRRIGVSGVIAGCRISSFSPALSCINIRVRVRIIPKILNGRVPTIRVDNSHDRNIRVCKCVVSLRYFSLILS